MVSPLDLLLMLKQFNGDGFYVGRCTWSACLLDVIIPLLLKENPILLTCFFIPSILMESLVWAKLSVPAQQ